MAGSSPEVKISQADLQDPGLARLNARLNLAINTAATASTTARQALSSSSIVSSNLTLSYSGSAGTVGEPFSGGLVASGGQLPYVYSLSGLPPGLSINTTSGVVSGVPTVAGTYSISGSVSDSGGNVVSRSDTIVITFNAQTRTVTVSGSQLGTDFIDLFDTSGITGSTDTLNGNINSSVTTLTMTSGAGAVVGTQIQIGTERMLITSGTAPTFDVERGYGGTTAAAHTTGATIDLPGALTFQLLSIASQPNRVLYLTKISTDINYVKILADAAASDIFPGVPTPAYILLADTSPALGSSQLVAPATGHVWYVAAGPGATGPAGASGSSTSLAPNITSATVVVGYQLNGYGPQLIALSGVITLPVSAPNYSDLAKIVVTSVDQNGVGHDVATLYAPFSGSTVNYNNATATQMSQPVVNETWPFLQFTAYDVNGVSATSPVQVGPISVLAAGITSAPFSEVGPRFANSSQSVQSTFSVTPVIANGQLPIGVTWFVDEGTGNPILKLQALLTQAGQSITFTDYVPLSSATINWVSYVLVGYVPSTISLVPYNSGTTYSAGQTATYSGKLYNSLSAGNTGNTPAPGGTAFWQDMGIPFAQSNVTIAVVGAPSATGAHIVVTNIAGAAPTPTNIFMGVNGVIPAQPYWQINITLNTAGASDPNAWFYGFWVEWVDSSGNPISPGGTTSIPGWEPDSNIENDGASHFIAVIGGYPAPGVDAYYKIGFWAISRAATATVAPFTGDPFCILQTNVTNPGPYHIGQPPTGNSTNMLVNPNFDQGSPSGAYTPSLMGWTVGAGGAVTATTIVVSGETVSVAQIITGGAAASLSQSFTVRQHDTYFYEEWIAATAGAGSGHVYIQLSFYNSSGGLVGSPVTEDVTALLTSTIAPFSVVGTVPTGAVTMVPAITTASGTSSTLVITNGWLGAGVAAPLVNRGNQTVLQTDQSMSVTNDQLGINQTLLTGPGANLVANPSGDAGFVGYTQALGGNFVVNTSVFYAPGKASFALSSVASPGLNQLLPTAVAAVPGQMFTGSAWIFSDSTAFVAFTLILEYLDSTGASIRSDTLASGVIATTTWSYISGPSASPAPAGTVSVQLVVYGTAFALGSGFAYVTNLSLYLMVTSTFMGTDAITVANATNVVQALALVDSIIATVGLNKLASTTVTQGTAIFTGDAIFSRGNGQAVMVLQDSGGISGLFMYSTCGISGGVVTPSTNNPYLAIEPTGVLISQGGAGNPFVQANASGVTVQGVTATSGAFTGFYYQTVIGPAGILISLTNGITSHASLNLADDTITLASGLFSNVLTASEIQLIYNGVAYITLDAGGGAIIGSTLSLTENGITTTINNASAFGAANGLSVTDGSFSTFVSSEFIGAGVNSTGQATVDLGSFGAGGGHFYGGLHLFTSVPGLSDLLIQPNAGNYVVSAGGGPTIPASCRLMLEVVYGGTNYYIPMF
jgi:Putative Ig domain